MGRPAQWPPKISRHASGQARIYIGGKHIYLGLYGSAEADKRYAEIVGNKPTERQIKKPGTTLAVLAAKYLAHAEAYYRDEDGRPTSQIEYVRRSLRILAEQAGKVDGKDFRPSHLKQIRQVMIGHGWSRSNINQHIKVIRQAFKWMVSEELVPVTVYQSLMTISHLKVGRTEAPETEPVRPVAMTDVESTLPQLGKHLQAAVRLQLLTAARPGEILKLKYSDIVRTNGIWKADLSRHKTRWRGKRRLLFIGPKAQQIIESLPKTGYLIQPGQAVKTKGRTKVSDHYNVRAYAHAIRRACQRAKVKGWSPHQLRHTAATAITEEYGIELARIILGHSSLSATMVYAEDSIRKAEQIIEKIG